MFRSVLDYVTSIEPTFLSRIAGVSELEVSELEVASRRRVPPSYREFLRLMGRSHNDLHFLLEGDTTFDAVLRFYREEAAALELPPEIMVIGVHEFPAFSMLWLNDDGGEASPVLAADYRGDIEGAVEAGDMFAASLANMVCHRAFYAYRVARARHRVTLYQWRGKDGRAAPRPSIMERAKPLVESEGFVPTWFSDAACSCHESQTSVLTITDFDYGRRGITIGFDEERQVSQVVEILRRELSLDGLLYQ